MANDLTSDKGAIWKADTVYILPQLDTIGRHLAGSLRVSSGDVMIPVSTSPILQHSSDPACEFAGPFSPALKPSQQYGAGSDNCTSQG